MVKKFEKTEEKTQPVSSSRSTINVANFPDLFLVVDPTRFELVNAGLNAAMVTDYHHGPKRARLDRGVKQNNSQL